jgi:hypothetical protein
MNQPSRHAELVVAIRNIALASDKIHAVQREALRLHPLIADSVIPVVDAMDALIDAALANGLYSTESGRQEVEHVVRGGLAGEVTLMPEPPASSQRDRVFDPPAPAELIWPVMAPDANHGVVGDVVRTIEPHTESDPAALLIQFLVATGNAIGRGPFYRIEGDLHFA